MPASDALLPVLTEVLEHAAVPAPGPNSSSLGEQLDAWLIDQLPGLVHECMTELAPRIEQQLLDALMPRLLASLAQWQDEL